MEGRMGKKIYQKLWDFQKESIRNVSRFMSGDKPQPLRPMLNYLKKTMASNIKSCFWDLMPHTNAIYE